MPASMECIICLDAIRDGNVSFMPCAHGFHPACINEWRRKKNECPICKTPINNGGIGGAVVRNARETLNDEHDLMIYASNDGTPPRAEYKGPDPVVASAVFASNHLMAIFFKYAVVTERPQSMHHKDHATKSMIDHMLRGPILDYY